MRLTAAKPDFRIRLNGVYMPEIRVQRKTPGGEIQLVVRDHDLGWFLIENSPDFILEYRDETSWALLPVEMKRASTDKCWNRTTPQELMGVLWATGLLK
jgi:hypothetical protein